MKKYLKLGLYSLLSLTILSCRSGEFDYLYKDLPFAMERLSRPDIPDRTALLTDFGGVGDGSILNTEAFARAIEALEAKGGGHLVVPAGIWRTGPITLKSNIDLHVTRNAVIVFDPALDIYPVIETNFEGLDTRRCESPINAEAQHDISITGEGVIDGSGEYWRPLKRRKVTESEWRKQLTMKGHVENDVWYPGVAYLEGLSLSDPHLNVPRVRLSEEDWLRIKCFLRPVMVSLRRCENVLLEGVTFQNSPAWNIHPLLCRNVIIKGLTVRNPDYSENGDGIDIDACENVLVLDSSFDVGDDGICIKSGKDEDGRLRGVACRNLLIDNCTVYHGHGGFVVGSEMSGGVENIKVSNCRFLGTDIGLRFKSKRGRGGVVRNIHISDIYMKDIVNQAILFDLNYLQRSAVIDEEFQIDNTTPVFRDITMHRIVCNGSNRVLQINGLPEMPVSNIKITDCHLTGRTGVYINTANDILMHNLTVNAAEGEPFTILNTHNVTQQ